MPSLQKAPLSTGSIMEPESDDPPVMHVTPTITTPTSKAPLSTGSITEPELDDPPVTHVAPRSESDDLVATSTNPGPKTMSVSESTTRLDCHCMFVTPSPPPPGSIYWKYFTREEDARWYDRSGTDKSFQAVRKMKQELQALLDT
ncbi:hypothetical protein EDD22DRAFT_848059 [Suillus occidentalis]|nr:hypothetical protein EDD22DRAFT_848059 [Suillus occidentalis]